VFLPITVVFWHKKATKQWYFALFCGFQAVKQAFLGHSRPQKADEIGLIPHICGLQAINRERSLCDREAANVILLLF